MGRLSRWVSRAAPLFTSERLVSELVSLGFGFVVATVLDAVTDLPVTASVLLALAAACAVAAALIARQERHKGRPSHNSEVTIGLHDTVSILKSPAPGLPGVPIVDFEANNRRDAHEDTGKRPTALRFIEVDQVEVDQTVRAADLPAKVQLGRRQALFIKQFTDTGFLLDELGVVGKRIRAEVYYA